MEKPRRPQKSKINFKIGSIHAKLNYRTKEQVFPSTDKSESAQRFKKAFIHIPRRVKQGTDRRRKDWEQSFRCKDITCPVRGQPAWEPSQTRGQDTWTRSHIPDTVVEQPDIWVRTRKRKVSTSHYHQHPRPWSVSNFIDPRERAKLDLVSYKPKKIDLPEHKTLYMREKERTRDLRKSKILEREYASYIAKEMRFIKAAGGNLEIERKKFLSMGFEGFAEKAQAKTKSTKSTYDNETLTTFLETQTQDTYVPHDILFYKLHKKRKAYRSCRDLIARQERRMNNIVREYYHEGTWKHSELVGSHMWSCCGNFEEFSQGCQCRKVNLMAWQTSSPYL